MFLLLLVTILNFGLYPSEGPPHTGRIISKFWGCAYSVFYSNPKKFNNMHADKVFHGLNLSENAAVFLVTITLQMPCFSSHIASLGFRICGTETSLPIDIGVL